MISQYDFVKRMSELYGLLQDDQSKALFWDRLTFDVAPGVINIIDMFADGIGLTADQGKEQHTIHQKLENLKAQGQRVFLYGGGVCGKALAECLMQENIPFYGFCDRSGNSEIGKKFGKPVVTPQYLLEHSSTSFAIITTIDYFEEIKQFLLAQQFPADHILPFFRADFANQGRRQYFEFPEKFRPGTAFVDGGCYDGADSIYFAQWCHGNYSKIFAFEPDSQNAEKCSENVRLAGVRDFELRQAGLSRECGTANFSAGNEQFSHIVDHMEGGDLLFDMIDPAKNVETVHLEPLDQIVGDTPVGFIKMDIEGAELEALRGAEKSLLRDKPLLAICIYHKAGDMLAIMDYLHTLIPEYHFWVRHYSPFSYETLLYASI